jgi:hypothetical protein
VSAAQNLPVFGLYARRGEFRRRLMEDDAADVSYLDGENFSERLDALRRGEFGFVGVCAEVDIVFGWGPDIGITHTIRSPGIWGIESDMGADYIGQCFDEECQSLESILADIGVTVT